MSVIERVKNAFRGRGRDESERVRSEVLDAYGAEILDSVPLEPPLGYKQQPSMFEVMRKMIADRERELAQAGYETPEEADDFDVDDDYDPSSPYEHDFDPPAEPTRLPDNLLRDVPPESPPQASGEVTEPPADGPATPPPAPVRQEAQRSSQPRQQPRTN